MFICKEHETIMWVFYWSIVDLQFYTSIVIHSLYFLILNQSILKISPGCSLEGLMLKLNTLATWCKQLTHLKRPWCWKDWRWEERGTIEDEMVEWHHQTQWTWVCVGSGSWMMDREAWRAAVHGVTKNRTRLSNWTELNPQPHPALPPSEYYTSKSNFYDLISSHTHTNTGSN